MLTVESAVVSADAVRAALANVTEVYEALQPYERKELVRLLLQRAEVGEHRITLEIRGRLQELPGACHLGGQERLTL